MVSQFTDREPGSNVGPDFGFAKSPIIPTYRGKYPGRNLVLDRATAAGLREKQIFAPVGSPDPYKCTDPFIVNAIGLPAATTAVRRYFRFQSNSKVPVRFDTRCRKCAACLKHRRRLWSARASAELVAAHRTWFATLTVAPPQRFVASMQASSTAQSAGHGQWNAMSSENQFRYLVDHLGGEVTKFLKRVRKHADLRYLLVSEAHKDGFPHFHMLIHEAALPLTKRLLESNWRLGYSQFRLVDSADKRSAFYVCKYLAKSAQTRVRASKGYGRAELIRAATEATDRVLADAALARGRPGPVPGVPQIKSD